MTAIPHREPGAALPGGIVEQIVAQNLAVYRAAPSRLQEDVSQEAQVASDYRGRLLFELLQNADDAMADGAGTDEVVFRVTESALEVANTGRPLTDADVQGLCGLGASSKAVARSGRRASIGHKGLGFKSVLEITDAPEVCSSTHSFRLGTRGARPLVEALWQEAGLGRPAGIPSMRFPSRMPDEEAGRVLAAHPGCGVVFRFPFHDRLDPEHRAALGTTLLELPTTAVLFLKHLERIRVEIDAGGVRRSRSWRLSRTARHGVDQGATARLSTTGLYDVTVHDEDGGASPFLVAHDADIAVGPHRGGLVGPAWEGVDLTEISVAVPAPEGGVALPEAARRFHVFLPTDEPSTYPLLVNGAFATDLARQHVRVTADSDDYNAHLVREAARVFRDMLLPALARTGPTAVLAALERDRAADGAAGLLHDALREALADVPLLPAPGGALLALPDAALPPQSVGEHGAVFRSLLGDEASFEGKTLPQAECCTGRWIAVAADHGGYELSAPEAVAVLAVDADAEATRLLDDTALGVEVDPVLDMCAVLWESVTGPERHALEAAVRSLPLFPVVRHEDRSVTRVPVEGETAFFPPRSARLDLPLVGLRFMCHSLCWGALLPKERTEVLGSRLAVWAALFDVHEFRFEEVVRAAVLPALVRSPTAEALELRSSLQDVRALAAVCQLAGAFARPDRPLRYQRLQSDRALFNLSRLPVPCRSPDGEERWLPAYRVYFGRDWLGDDSVEALVDAVRPELRTGLDVAFLAPPDRLLGTLGSGAGSASAQAGNGAVPDDEVDVDEDTDQAIETDEKERWLAFLSWIGTNRCLRLVHFHDVEDEAAGWLSTKDLEQPRGRAFAGLGQVWTSWRAELLSQLGTRLDGERLAPYLYEAHDLDQADVLLAAVEQDVSGATASALLGHLSRHWTAVLAGRSTVQVALVDRGKWPGSRSKPQRAMPDELTDAGNDLWVHRLRSRAVCPTSHGPRRASLCWQPSTELTRRFGRRDRAADELLPIVRVQGQPAPAALRALSDRLGVRTDLTPSSFTAEDARQVCERLAELFADGRATLDAAALRNVVRPTYRQVFELLAGRVHTPDRALADVPLLATGPHGLKFLPARDVLYARTPGLRERSQVSRELPCFILEAEPSATAPLTSLFGVRLLEEELRWTPSPGEAALEQDDLRAFRTGLAEMMPPLLARIRAERTEARDVRLLRAFARAVEPVDSLVVRCHVGEQELVGADGRTYFVAVPAAGEDVQAFVRWSGPAWPPAPEDAQTLAMALADLLGMNLVETFLAFLSADTAHRARLLDLAGASGHLADAQADLQESDILPDPAPTGGADEGPAPLPPTAASDAANVATAVPVTAGPARIPLIAAHLIDVHGTPVLVAGEAPAAEASDFSSAVASIPGATSGRRAAAGTDLSELDALGMSIVLRYEEQRLVRAGCTSPQIVRGDGPFDSRDLVIPVDTPAAISHALAVSEVARYVLEELREQGLSLLHPGFDVLTIRSGAADRAIELKSSGVDAQVQEMSWNEWKAASGSALRHLFWLYLAGNLRADLPGLPYVRAVHDPFGALVGRSVEQTQSKRSVQLRVREFASAEHLDLTVQSSGATASSVDHLS